jgi:cell division septum initiation protein DivIVA
LLNRQDTNRQDLVQAVDAADRAGTIVTEQVRSIIEAAEANAEEIRRSAHRDAYTIRQGASDAASRILERLDALERPLGDLVTGLRQEADSLTADLDRRASR